MSGARALGQIVLAILLGAAGFKMSTPVAAKVGKAAGQGGAPKAGPEMERLQKFYLGTWDYTETYGKSPAAPQGGTGSGVYTSELGPGGNSIVNRFHSHGASGDSEGLLVMTWDPKEGAYKSYVFGGDFPGCLIETGHFEGDVLEYRAEIKMGGMKLKLRNVTRLAAPDKIVSEEYMAASEAPEKLLVTVEAKKRPQ